MQFAVLLYLKELPSWLSAAPAPAPAPASAPALSFRNSWNQNVKVRKKEMIFYTRKDSHNNFAQ